jgi:hypothetical protein
MKNDKYDVDELLRKALKSEEVPSEALIHKLKKDLNKKENNNMGKRKVIKFSVAIAAALIAVLSLSFVALGDHVWRVVPTRVIEGGEFAEIMVKEEISGYGFLHGIVVIEGDFADEGRLVVEVDGEIEVWRDPLNLTDLGEALALFPEEAIVPTYLPEGFVFERAQFPLSPITNPELDHAGGQLILTFGNGEETFMLEIRRQHERYGFDIWGLVEEITINGQEAIIGSGGLSIHTSPEVRNTFFGWGVLDDDTLIRMAESLQ